MVFAIDKGGIKMKKVLLVVLLIAAIFYGFSMMYEVKSGRSPDGTYHVVLMNKSSGGITQLIGGK